MLLDRSPNYVLSADERTVECWSARRLPFEPRGWLRDLRAALGAHVRELRAQDGELLQAVYASEAADAVDAENVLFYNVGPGCFATAASAGIRFERAFSAPEPPVALTGSQLHHTRYQIAAAQVGFLVWSRGPLLATWDSVPCPPLSERTNPAVIWHAAKRAGVTSQNIQRQPGRPYGLELTIQVPETDPIAPVRVLKPLLDGLISSLHSHDGTSMGVIAERLRVQAPTASADELATMLADDAGAVLGKRRLLWARANGVQWNPADDLCHACELRVQRVSAHGWSVSGSAFEILPA
jgi:hypothetical protein